MELLHFTADWCNPCKKMEPVISEFLSENPEIVYTKIDVDEDSERARIHGVMGIPTFLSIDGGYEKSRGTGVMQKSELKHLFE